MKGLPAPWCASPKRQQKHFAPQGPADGHLRKAPTKSSTTDLPRFSRASAAQRALIAAGQGEGRGPPALNNPTWLTAPQPSATPVAEPEVSASFSEAIGGDNTATMHNLTSPVKWPGPLQWAADLDGHKATDEVGNLNPPSITVDALIRIMQGKQEDLP